MVTSKSTLTVARMALRAARDALPDYARSRSPKKFTQPQLVACLIVKEFEGKDYRGFAVMLSEWSDLRNVLGLNQVLHFTTLCQAAKRFFRKGMADRLLSSVLSSCRNAKFYCTRNDVRKDSAYNKNYPTLMIASTAFCRSSSA